MDKIRTTVQNLRRQIRSLRDTVSAEHAGQDQACMRNEWEALRRQLHCALQDTYQPSEQLNRDQAGPDQLIQQDNPTRSAAEASMEAVASSGRRPRPSPPDKCKCRTNGQTLAAYSEAQIVSLHAPAKPGKDFADAAQPGTYHRPAPAILAQTSGFFLRKARRQAASHASAAQSAIGSSFNSGSKAISGTRRRLCICAPYNIREGPVQRIRAETSL